MLVTLLQHDQWANGRVFAAVAGLPEETIHADVGLSHETPFQLLLHMLDVEWSWRCFATGHEAKDVIWEVEPIPDMKALERVWTREDAQTLDWAHDLTEDDLAGRVDYGSAQGGEPAHVAVGDIVLHMATHSAHHRGELVQFLKRHERSPGDVGVMTYLAEEGAS